MKQQVDSGLTLTERRRKPYPEYKDSGVGWLGTIPAGWRVTTNLSLFDERKEKGFAQLPPYSVTQAHGVVPQEYGADEIVRSAEDKSSYKRIAPGDLVYNKMRMWQGAVGRALAEGIVSPAYVVCRPRRAMDTRYFEYLYRTDLLITQCGRHSYGICDDMNSLRFKDFKTIPSLVPPLSEQRAIADFLDRQTAKIDALIAKKERLIELLQEKRTALISRSVTKGLDPNVPMKDSGIDWVGEIPAHWDAKPLKVVTPYVSRGNGPYYVNESQIGVVNQACIYWDALHLESVKYQAEVDVSGWKGLLHQGDLLLNSTGTGTLGRAALFEEHQGIFIADSHVTIVRLSTEAMSAQYAFYLVQTPLYQGYIYASLVSGSTNQIELSREKLRATPVIIPPLLEQHAIAEFLDRETPKIDALAAKVGEAIERLKEYRTALISAAVTGKIDVREAVS